MVVFDVLGVGVILSSGVEIVFVVFLFDDDFSILVLLSVSRVPQVSLEQAELEVLVVRLVPKQQTLTLPCPEQLPSKSTNLILSDIFLISSVLMMVS